MTSFKLLATKLTRNGLVNIEQTFLGGEKDFAAATAAKLQENAAEFTNVRLLETTIDKTLVPVAVSIPDNLYDNGVTEFKRKRLTGAKFAWVKFGKPAPKVKATRKAKTVAAPAGEFDLPPAPKKRLTKRQRAFGADALHRTLDAVEA